MEIVKLGNIATGTRVRIKKCDTCEEYRQRSYTNLSFDPIMKNFVGKIAIISNKRETLGRYYLEFDKKQSWSWDEAWFESCEPVTYNELLGEQCAV